MFVAGTLTIRTPGQIVEMLTINNNKNNNNHNNK